MNLYREFATQDEIDQAYNVELSVPDFSIYRDLYIGESARVRDDYKGMLDVRFGPTIEETIDIFPSDDPHAPILVFIHGGYWRILSSKEFSLVARAPVEAGYTVVVTNYSLCPKVTIAEITRQSRAALAWLATTDTPFNGDKNRIYVAGHSAGGQQTARVLSTDWQGEYGLPADVIKGGLSISGLFDLRPLRYSWLQPKLLLDHDIIERESPMFHLPETAPPLMVTVGEEEPSEFIRQSKDYCDAWSTSGLQGNYQLLSGKNHFSAIDGFLDQQSDLMGMLNNLVGR